MGRLTLADLQTQVQDYIPARAGAKIARFANMAIREIYREVGPVGRSTFTLGVPKTAGTIAVTQDSTAIVGTGTAFASSDVDGFIKIDGQDTWFSLASQSDTTNGVLSSAWPGDTDSGLSYTLVQPYVNLPAVVGDITEAWIASKWRLQRVSNELRPDVWGTLRLTRPEWYALAGFGTDGRRRIQVIYPQDSRYTVTYTYREAPVLFDAGDTTSVTSLPPEYDDMVIAKSLAYGFAQIDKPQSALFWQSEYKDLLRQVKARNLVGHDDRLGSMEAQGLHFSHGLVTETS